MINFSWKSLDSAVNLAVTTYKDKKLTGWYGKGFTVTKYID